MKTLLIIILTFTISCAKWNGGGGYLGYLLLTPTTTVVDPDPDPTPTITAPEIEITSYATGSTYDYANIVSGASSSIITFTIENTGDADLTLTSVVKSGTDNAMFDLTQPGSMTVAASGSETFTVQFNPSSVGAKTAEITITNDDSDEGTYIINLTGTGISWWDTDWTSRRKITFNNTGIGVLNNIPILVSLADGANIDYAKTQNSGQDIRFIESDDATSLSYEIEEWNEGGVSVVWVKVPQIDSGSTTDYIWMYYNNAGAAHDQNAPDVWSNGYAGVWHFNGVFTDSLGANNGTDNSTSAETGQMAGARGFNGNNQWVNIGTDVVPTGTNHTISAWVYMNLAGSDARRCIVCDNQTANPYGGIDMYIQRTTGEIGSHLDGTWYWSTPTVSTNAWALISVRFFNNAGAGTIETSKDGAAWENVFTGDTSNDAIQNTWILDIGRFPDPDEYAKGNIDEVRISTVSRSDDWISAQYKTMTEAYQTYGSEEDLLLF